MRCVCLLVLLLAGCSSQTPASPKATVTYSYRLDVSGDWANTPLKFMADGKVVAEAASPSGLPEQLQVLRELVSPMSVQKAREMAWSNKDGRPVPGLPVITAKALEPCGWKPVEVRVLKPAWPAQQKPDVIELDAHVGSARNTMYVQGQPGMTAILVDNRGGGQRELRIGEWSYKVGADSAQMVYAGLADCDAAKTVLLDGVEIAALPEERSATMLLDTSGKRCYYFRGLNYFSAGEQGWSPWRYPLARKHLHVIKEANGKIDYLFTEGPPKVKSALGFEQKSELTERACAGPE